MQYHAKNKELHIQLYVARFNSIRFHHLPFFFLSPFSFVLPFPPSGCGNPRLGWSTLGMALVERRRPDLLDIIALSWSLFILFSFLWSVVASSIWYMACDKV